MIEVDDKVSFGGYINNIAKAVKALGLDHIEDNPLTGYRSGDTWIYRMDPAIASVLRELARSDGLNGR